MTDTDRRGESRRGPLAEPRQGSLAREPKPTPMPVTPTYRSWPLRSRYCLFHRLGRRCGIEGLVAALRVAGACWVMLCLILTLVSPAADASPSESVICGTVQTAPGVPVPGTSNLPSPVQDARVVARNAQTGKEFVAKTSARGRFTLTVPPGSYVVRAAHSMQTVTVAPGQRKLVNFVIPVP